MDQFWLVFLAGCGGYLLHLAADWARDTRKPARGQSGDGVAELERMVKTYRAEVTDLADLVERRYRRERKRDQRDAPADTDGAGPPAEISTGDFHSFSTGDIKAKVGAMIATARRKAGR